RWSERRAYSPGAAEGLGRQPAGPPGEGVADARSDPEGVQRLAFRWEESLTCRPDRSGRRRRDREGREGCRPRRGGTLHAGPDGCLGETDRRALLRAARTGRRRVSQLCPWQTAPVG